MLVLTRKLGEKVIIDGDITVTLVAMDRGRVRLGFEAPRQVPVVREELVSRRGSRGEFDRDPVAKLASQKNSSPNAELLLTL
jgi:carbon storage regulator